MKLPKYMIEKLPAYLSAYMQFGLPRTTKIIHMTQAEAITRLKWGQYTNEAENGWLALVQIRAQCSDDEWAELILFSKLMEKSE